MLNLLKNGEVVQQIPNGGAVNIDGVHASPVEAGWTYGPYLLVEAEPEPPTPEQIRAAMRPLEKWRFETIVDVKKLREPINAAIAAMPEQERTVAFNKRNHVPEFYRDDPLFDALGPALGMTPEQIDIMWRAALEL